MKTLGRRKFAGWKRSLLLKGKGGNRPKNQRREGNGRNVSKKKMRNGKEKLRIPKRN